MGLPPASPSSPTTEASVAKLSTRLLEGWTMLSETCPQPGCSVPLMRSRDRAEISCVSCETQFTDDYEPILSTARMTPAPAAEDPVAAPSTRSAPPSPPPPAEEPGFVPAAPEPSQRHARTPMQKDQSCKGLAEKLLQGWTLTDQYCPICLTPLVRNKERQLMCVGCDKWVVPESEVPPTPPPKPKPEPKPEAPKARPAGTGGSKVAICERAMNVLFAKMDACVSRMEGVAQVPGEEATEILEFISTASKTILAVNDVKDCIS